MARLSPVHPGEVLLEELLKPLGLSQNRLALAIGVHPRRIRDVGAHRTRRKADPSFKAPRRLCARRQIAEGTQPRSLRLTDAKISTTGVIIATYEPAGPLEVGTIGA